LSSQAQRWSCRCSAREQPQPSLSISTRKLSLRMPHAACPAHPHAPGWAERCPLPPAACPPPHCMRGAAGGGVRGPHSLVMQPIAGAGCKCMCYKHECAAAATAAGNVRCTAPKRGAGEAGARGRQQVRLFRTQMAVQMEASHALFNLALEHAW